MRHLELRITGKVQGVSFRSLALALAKDLGLTGYIENLADGSVHIEAEGTVKDLENLLVEWSDRYCGYYDFSIHE